MNQFNHGFPLKIAEHSSSCDTFDSRILFILNPIIETPYVGSRSPYTEVFEGSSSRATFDYPSNILKVDTWYHFAIINDQKDSLIRNYVNYQSYQQGGLRLRRLTECPFYIGDDSGDPVKFFEDSFFTIKELRTWNEARTYG